jgi:hypothetical protein
MLGVTLRITITSEGLEGINFEVIATRRIAEVLGVLFRSLVGYNIRTINDYHQFNGCADVAICESYYTTTRVLTQRLK